MFIPVEVKKSIQKVGLEHVLFSQIFKITGHLLHNKTGHQKRKTSQNLNLKANQQD